MSLAKLFFALGVAFLVLAALFAGVPGLNRLGRLPGDVRIEGNGYGFYFPWVTCLLISAILSLIFYFVGKGKS